MFAFLIAKSPALQHFQRRHLAAIQQENIATSNEDKSQ